MFAWGVSPDSIFYGATRDSQGSLTAVGATDVTRRDDQPALVRLDGFGALDRGFGRGGYVRAPFGANRSGKAARGRAQDVAVAPSGDLFVGGEAVIDGYHHFAIAKFKGGPPDFTPPRVRLLSASRRARHKRQIRIRVRCDEDCSLRVTGWVHASERIALGHGGSALPRKAHDVDAACTNRAA